MKLISHRGNVNGKTSLENSPSYILDALKSGFDVEIDVWFFDEKIYFGHDCPLYIEPENFIDTYKNNIWLHAKNLDVLDCLKEKKCVYFWHQNDDTTLTSNGYFWMYPGKKLLKNSIAVLPEQSNYNNFSCYGICSDYIKNYEKYE